MSEQNHINRYKILMEVRIKHHYYQAGYAKDLTVQPTIETQKTMANHQMIFKPDAQGFRVVCSPNKAMNFEKHPIKLSFYLRCDNPYFINLTDLPLTSGVDTLLYFTNSGKKTGQLTSDSVAGVADQLNCKGAITRVPLNGETAKLTVKDVLGNEVYQLEGLKGNKQVNLDLSREVDGKYSLERENEPPMNFLRMERSSSNSIGFIELVLDKEAQTWVNQNLENTTKAISYEIAFGQRSTIWKYLLINRHKDIHYEDYNIKMQQQTSLFSQEEDIRLSNGDTAIVLVSEQPIALQERYTNKLQLEMKRAGKGISMKVNLPTPDPNRIVPEGTSLRKIYSEIYVYL